MQRVYVVFVGLLLLAVTGCQSKKTNLTFSTVSPQPEVSMSTSPSQLTPPTATEIAEYTELAKSHNVRLTTRAGVIDLELYPDVAPVHVANFLKLIQVGFYNGLTFHRVVPGFVIQGGDPLGNGTGGPGYQIQAEFSARKHLTGTLAMARSADPNSAGSQFYITLADQPGLDGQYTVFGQTISDLAVLGKVQLGDPIEKIELIAK